MNIPWARIIPSTDTKDSVVALTPLGTERVEKFQGSGLGFQALGIIHDEGPTSVTEMGQRLHTDREKTRFVINQLIKAGLVRKVH